MPANQTAVLLRHLRDAVGSQPEGGDAVLLERFARHADEAAFAALVRRHGPLVWGVSQRVTRHTQDAEDVYQATFLLLARKAASIHKGNSLASWLYGVAHRLALRVRRDAARRRQREAAAIPTAETTADDLTWRELRAVLDEELACLPEKYRTPLLLCYFEGLTQEEAAQHLGWSRRSVKDRLGRGRDRLRGRLARRGLTLPMALAGPLLAGGLAFAPPAALAEAAVHAALPFARRQRLAEGFPVQAVALAEGGLRAMFVGKLLTLAAGLLAATLLGGSVLLAAWAAQSPGPAASGQAGRGAVDRYGDPLPPGAVTRLGTVRYRFAASGSTFLPDGKTIVSLGAGGPIQFWDARTGRLLREVAMGPFSPGQARAFSRDARRLAVSGSLREANGVESGTVVRVYDTTSGKEVRTFARNPREGANALALSPDGNLLFSLDRMGKLRVEEVATGALRLQHKFPADVVAALALSADGSTLALASGPNTRKLFLWKWRTAKEPSAVGTAGHRSRALAFSPDGKRLADCSDDYSTVRVWDVEGGRLLHRLELPDHRHYWHHHTAFSPDGKLLAAAGRTNYEGAVHLWDPATGKFLQRLDVGSGTVAFSPDGTLMAAGSRVWDFAAGKELSANDEAHRSEVQWVVTGANGVVVTASGDNTIRIWDAVTGKQRQCLIHKGWIRDLALSPDSTHLASNSLDDTVCLWDVATGRKIYQLPGHGRLGGRRAVAFTPDGKSLLAWGDDLYLRQWDVRTGKALREHTIRPSGVQIPKEDDRGQEEKLFHLGDGLFTPDGRYLLLQVERHFFVFDAATGKELRKFPSASHFLIGRAISPDGKTLLGTAWGESIRIPGSDQFLPAQDHPVTWWDVGTGKQLNQLRLPEGQAGPVAFSPDGKRFAVASARPGPRIRVVELATGREAHRIEGFRGLVRSLAFTPDGKRLVSGMEDSTALIWDLTR